MEGDNDQTIKKVANKTTSSRDIYDVLSALFSNEEVNSVINPETKTSVSISQNSQVKSMMKLGQDEFQIWLNTLINNTDIPLFSTGREKIIHSSNADKNGKRLILRHPAMELKVINEVEKLEQDYYKGSNEFEGIFTLIYTREEYGINLLAITSSKKLGNNGQSFNVNLKAITKGKKEFFARWGDNLARNIGGLSYELFKGPDDPELDNRMTLWKNVLFSKKGNEYYLKKDIFFSAKAWGYNDTDYRGEKINLNGLCKKIEKEFPPFLSKRNLKKIREELGIQKQLLIAESKKDLNDLKEYLSSTMKINDLYQPFIIKQLILNNGCQSIQDLAISLASIKNIEKQQAIKILKRAPNDTLKKHKIAYYKQDIDAFVLLITFEISSPIITEIIKICNKKMEKYV